MSKSLVQTVSSSSGRITLMPEGIFWVRNLEYMLSITASGTRLKVSLAAFLRFTSSIGMSVKSTQYILYR